MWSVMMTKNEHNGDVWSTNWPSLEDVFKKAAQKVHNFDNFAVQSLKVFPKPRNYTAQERREIKLSIKLKESSK